MIWLISIALAFGLSGVAHVTKDLGGRVIDRPMWAIDPTFGKAVFAAATWWAPFFIDKPEPRGRVIALGVWAIASQLAVLTLFVWTCMSLAGWFFDHPVAQFLGSAVLIVVSMPIVLPLLSVVMIPLTLLIGLPLDWLFPSTSSPKAQTVQWCRECQHYRKSKDFEDIITGLWRAASMPRSDKLPCAIPLEAAEVWSQYFGSAPGSRTLFPKDCPLFVSRKR
jgi:hypothetical protein